MSTLPFDLFLDELDAFIRAHQREFRDAGASIDQQAEVYAEMTNLQQLGMLIRRWLDRANPATAELSDDHCREVLILTRLLLDEDRPCQASPPLTIFDGLGWRKCREYLRHALFIKPGDVGADTTLVFVEAAKPWLILAQAAWNQLKKSPQLSIVLHPADAAAELRPVPAGGNPAATSAQAAPAAEPIGNPTIKPALLAAHLTVSVKTLARRAKEVGIRRANRGDRKFAWTVDEAARLVKHYRDTTISSHVRSKCEDELNRLNRHLTDSRTFNGQGS